jgi:opacity protein-like surface antigen
MAASIALGVVSPVFAQDQGRIGLTMGYPPAVGLVFKVTDGFALRPEFTFSQSSIETEINTTGSPSVGGNASDSWTSGIGVSALIYLSTRDSLRTYVSPRVQFSWLSGESSSPTTLSGAPAITSESTGSAFGVSAAFGAQYALGDRFSVFGEIGLGYSDSETETTTGSSGIPLTIRQVSNSSGFGIRTGAGVILWF